MTTSSGPTKLPHIGSLELAHRALLERADRLEIQESSARKSKLESVADRAREQWGLTMAAAGEIRQLVEHMRGARCESS